MIASACLLAFAGAAAAQGATYTIDPTHTFVSFEYDHFGISTSRGRFDRKQGQVQLDRAAQRGRVEVSFETASVNTGTAALDRQLRSAEFFAVDKFPSATFVGDGFVFDGDKLVAVAGTLTLLGKTVPVTLKATRFACYLNPLFRREVCGGDFEASVARSQWGLTWGLGLGFSDNVKLLVQVEAIKQ